MPTIHDRYGHALHVSEWPSQDGMATLRRHYKRVHPRAFRASIQKGQRTRRHRNPYGLFRAGQKFGEKGTGPFKSIQEATDVALSQRKRRKLSRSESLPSLQSLKERGVVKVNRRCGFEITEGRTCHLKAGHAGYHSTSSRPPKWKTSEWKWKEAKKKSRRNPLPSGFTGILKRHIRSGKSAPDAMRATWKEIKKRRTKGIRRTGPRETKHAKNRKSPLAPCPYCKVVMGRESLPAHIQTKHLPRPNKTGATLIYNKVNDIYAQGHVGDKPGQVFRHKFTGRHKVYGLPNGDVYITDRKLG